MLLLSHVDIPFRVDSGLPSFFGTYLLLFIIQLLRDMCLSALPYCSIFCQSSEVVVAKALETKILLNY